MQFILKPLLLAAAAGLALSTVTAAAHERDGGHGRGDDDPARGMSFAVIGDWPYSQNLVANAARLSDSVNADRSVDLLIHVGDIHAGSMPCTSAGILPPIQSADPGWNQHVFAAFEQFRVPVVYTPGDNEWSDCHKSKEKSSGAPLAELASVRELFFATPGETLGRDAMQVSSQALDFDPAYPADAQFVENVMWSQGGVVFVTVNLPGGSNNDAAPWSPVYAGNGQVVVYPTDAQLVERSERTAADIRWLQRAFARARHERARGVVIATQADLWDPEFAPVGQLSNYAPFVEALAGLAGDFRRPVLLLNGDTHEFLEDYPLADPASTTGQVYGLDAVPNLRRVVVKGSTNMPAEWLRIRVDPRDPAVFGVIRARDHVSYCNADTPSCH